MTRINVVSPSELSGKHLVAEYRELPRVFRLAAAWHLRGGDTSSLPADYTLGKGHVSFFYTRLLFVVKRHRALVDEMRARGYTVNIPDPDRHGAPAVLFNDYVPTQQALLINRQRIQERL